MILFKILETVTRQKSTKQPSPKPHQGPRAGRNSDEERTLYFQETHRTFAVEEQGSTLLTRSQCNEFRTRGKAVMHGLNDKKFLHFEIFHLIQIWQIEDLGFNFINSSPLCVTCSSRHNLPYDKPVPFLWMQSDSLRFQCVDCKLWQV